MPTMGSLFAGIGGFDLGFTRAGFDVSWQVEIDPWCRKVLAKNFPKAERFDDVRECGRHNLRPVDVICGGFPCQDISIAGLKAGITGERSGLWKHYARIIGELQPAVVLVENVSALLSNGMGVVIGDLAELGYDAEWQIIPASAVGAIHLRERIWIVAYTDRFGLQGSQLGVPKDPGEGDFYAPLFSSLSLRERIPKYDISAPYITGTNDGIPHRAHRIRGLGNAVVPQIPEMYARKLFRILADSPVHNTPVTTTL